MVSNIIFFPLLALALGLKHAYDADHLVAVSNFLTRSKSIRDTTRMTVSWAIGHMVTAAIITVSIFTLTSQIESITETLSRFESVVAIMLITVGIGGILSEITVVHDHYHRHLGSIHRHTHKHRFGGLGGFAHRTHLHPPLLSVGIIHGLASNDELFTLLVTGLSIGSLEILLGGVTVFTVGVVLGMMLFGVAVTSPLLGQRISRARPVINIAAGSLSIVYGLLIMMETSGFNPLDLLIVP